MSGEDRRHEIARHGCVVFLLSQPKYRHCVSVDDVLSDLFSNLPDLEAQMPIEFSYHTSRITVSQDGTAEFIEMR